MSSYIVLKAMRMYSMYVYMYVLYSLEFLQNKVFMDIVIVFIPIVNTHENCILQN